MSDVTELADGLSALQRLHATGRRGLRVWSEIGSPVIDRGSYAIFPLAVAPLPAEGELDEFLLGKEGALLDAEWRLRRACIHFYGGDDFHAEMPVKLDQGYGWSLSEVGFLAPRADWVLWWDVGGYAVILVRALDREHRLETLALHVTPMGWVYDSALYGRTEREERRARRLFREGKAADASWSLP